MADTDGMARVVAQVKVDGRGASKWQFEFGIWDGATPKERDDVVHSRAARTAKANRESGAWPLEGDVLVWYAEIDDLARLVDEHPWHPLKAAEK